MSQDLSTLRNFFAFGRWANRTILESVAALTPEEYARLIGGSFGSVQGTLVHLYGADWVWLERFHGRSPRAMPAGNGWGQAYASHISLIRSWSDRALGCRCATCAVDPLPLPAFIARIPQRHEFERRPRWPAKYRRLRSLRDLRLQRTGERLGRMRPRPPA
jgi:hypothetical protein